MLVIDSVRNIEEIETFEKELGKGFLLVGIQVSNEGTAEEFKQKIKELFNKI